MTPASMPLGQVRLMVKDLADIMLRCNMIEISSFTTRKKMLSRLLVPINDFKIYVTDFFTLIFIYQG